MFITLFIHGHVIHTSTEQSIFCLIFLNILGRQHGYCSISVVTAQFCRHLVISPTDLRGQLKFFRDGMIELILWWPWDDLEVTPEILLQSHSHCAATLWHFKPFSHFSTPARFLWWPLHHLEIISRSSHSLHWDDWEIVQYCLVTSRSSEGHHKTQWNVDAKCLQC